MVIAVGFDRVYATVLYLGMAVPDYQTLMLPLLAYLADGSMRSTVPVD